MNKSLNIDQVFEHVKNICDINRCTICDTLDGSRMRYSCGHSACDQCATVAEDCMLCLTPPNISTPCTPILDAKLTERVKHASDLLETCQEVFHTDVYQWKRLSEQMKIEKELFPKCIQAPVKYCNKRKSLNSSTKYKENRDISYLPGEEISLTGRKMENSTNFVRDWLNKYEMNLGRKPFTDLSTNKQINNSIHYSNKKALTSRRGKKNYRKQSPTKKRQSLDSANCTLNNKSHKEEIGTPSEEPCMKKRKRLNKSYNDQKSMNDESGIVIDDEPIIIDDSQSILIDKDREACLAVLAADENTQYSSDSEIALERSDIVNCTTDVLKSFVEPTEVISKTCAKVPFYKKSYILETCKLCNNVMDNKYKKSDHTFDKLDNVSITVESQSFITTINVYRVEENLSNNKESVEIQTEIDDASKYSDKDLVKGAEINNDHQYEQALPLEIPNGEIRQDIFATTKNSNKVSITSEKTGNKCIVIEESDSEIDSDPGPVEVTADIHRSCEPLDYGVLNEVCDPGELGGRPRRGARGLTPTSTDSSEKENFNPNRIKKIKPGKKYKKEYCYFK